MNQVDWIGLYKFIDARGQDNTWKLAKICNIEGDNLAIAYDGPENYTAVLPRSSKNIAPFRRYTIKNPDISLGKRSFCFSLDQFENIEKKIEEYIHTEISTLDPYEITQFYRGELYIYIENLLEYDYCSDVKLSERILQFFIKTLHLIINFIIEYCSIFQFSNEIDDPELYLIDKTKAIISSWPEVLDILNKLLAFDTNYRKFFDNYNFTPQDFNLKGWYCESSFYSASAIYMINDFIENQGLKILMDLCSPSASFWKIPLKFFCSLPIYNLKAVIPPFLSAEFYSTINHGIFQRISELKEQDLKELDFSILIYLISNIKKSESDISGNTLDKYLLFLLCKMIKSGYMEKRVQGIIEICNFLDNNLQNSLSDAEKFEIINNEAILFEILEERVHSEILKRSIPFIRFISKQKMINDHECKLILELTKSIQQPISETSFAIVLEILPDLSVSQVDLFYKKLTSASHTEANLKVIGDFTRKIIEADIDYNISENSFLNEIMLDSSSAKRWLEAVDELIKILAQPKVVEAKLKFFEIFKTKLEDLDSVFQYISIAIGLIPTLDKNEIIKIFEDDKTKEKIFKNIKLYMESISQKAVSRKTIVQNFLHKEQVSIRLKILECIIKHSSNLVIITKADLKFLWNTFVLNYKSSRDRVLFFVSLYNGIKYSPLTNNFEDFFSFFLKKKYFNYEISSVSEFKAFKKFFLFNNYPKNLELEQNKLKYIKSKEINGIKQTAKVLINCKEKIAKKIFKLLTSILTMISLKIFDTNYQLAQENSQVYEYASEIFQRHFEYILKIHEKKSSNPERILKFLINLLQLEEFESKSAEFIVINMQNNETQKVSLPIKGKIRLYRKIISEFFKIPLNFVCLEIENRLFSNIKNEKIISLHENSKIIIRIQEEEYIEFNPKDLLSKNKQILQLLYNALNDKNTQEMSWLLLKNLPVSKDLRDSLFALNTPIEQIFPESSLEFLHFLHIIQEFASDESWLLAFIDKGGSKIFIEKFINIISNYKFLNTKQYEILLNILSSILTLEIQNPFNCLESIFQCFLHISSFSLELENSDKFVSVFLKILNHFWSKFSQVFNQVTGNFIANHMEIIIKIIIDGKGNIDYIKKIINMLAHLVKICNHGDEVICLLTNFISVTIGSNRVSCFWEFVE